MVSARKNKARLDKSALARLKKKNAKSQAKELELSPEALGRIGDELVSATIQGFNEELASSPAPIRALAKQFSGLIEEFFKGFQEGVNAEIKEFVKNNRKISETTVEDIEKVTTTNIRALTETVTDVVEEKAKEPGLTKEKTNEAVSSILARKEGGASAILDKKFNFKDFLTQASLGAIGQGDVAEEIISKRNEKEAFIQTETKLRSEEFKGMSSEDVRKKLEEDYKTIQTTTEELKKLEEQISTYKDMGYSPAQIEKIGGFDEQKKALVEQATKADPTRMEKYAKYVGGDTTAITDARQSTSDINNIDTGSKNVNFKDESVKTSSTSTSLLEESIQEQAVAQEKTSEEQEKQTTLLAEIRDLIRAQKDAKQKEKKSASEDTQGDGGMPDIDIDLPDRRGRATRPSRAGKVGKTIKGMIPKGATGAIGSAAGKAIPFLAAGASLYGGVSDLAEGKKVETLSDAVPEGWNKLNPFDWAMKGGMYVGEKINQGFEGVVGDSIGSKVYEGIDAVSSLWGGSDAQKMAAGSPTPDKVRSEKIKNETEYLKKKNPTIEETKKIDEKEKSTVLGLNFSENTFREKDPESYEKFNKFRADRYQELLKTGPSGWKPATLSKWAQAKSKQDAIEKFKKEIEAASASTPRESKELEKTSAEQKTPTEAKQEALPAGAPNSPPEVPAAAEGRKIADIAKPDSSVTVNVPAPPPSDLVKTSEGSFTPGKPTTPERKGNDKASINVSLTTFQEKDPENYQKFVKEVESRTATLTQEYFNSGRFGKSANAKLVAKSQAQRDAKNETILKFKKEIEAAGAGTISSTKEGAPAEQPATIDKVKNSFGMGEPTIESAPGETKPAEAKSATTSAMNWKKPTAGSQSAEKLRKVEEEAKKQGIPGKVKGKFEGGVLTSIIDESGKSHPVELKESDRQVVEGIRALRAGNNTPSNLEQADLDSSSTQPRQMPSSLKEAPVDNSVMNAAAAMGKNIVVQSPPPVVVPSGGGNGGQTIVSQPFTNNIRNTEPTLNKYLASRYITS